MVHSNSTGSPKSCLKNANSSSTPCKKTVSFFDGPTVHTSAAHAAVVSCAKFYRLDRPSSVGLHKVHFKRSGSFKSCLKKPTDPSSTSCKKTVSFFDGPTKFLPAISNVVASCIEFNRTDYPSVVGHPVTVHSNNRLISPKSCLKKPANSFFSHENRVIVSRKKKVSFFDGPTEFVAAPSQFPWMNRHHRLGKHSLLYAPRLNGPYRFVTKLPGLESRPLYESRASIAWSCVRRYQDLKIKRFTGTIPVDFAIRSKRAPSMPKTFAPTSQVPVVRLPQTSNVCRPVSQPVQITPQPVVATSKLEDVSASSQAVVRLPSKSEPQVVQRTAGVSMPTLSLTLLALALLVGYWYEGIWDIILLIAVFIIYATRRLTNDHP